MAPLAKYWYAPRIDAPAFPIGSPLEPNLYL